MKPQLPECLCALIPDDVLGVINSFVPHLPKPKKEKRKDKSLSPDAQRDLRLIQQRAMRGVDPMYLRDLEDFILY
jgi:hypothetical protein